MISVRGLGIRVLASRTGSFVEFLLKPGELAPWRSGSNVDP